MQSQFYQVNFSATAIYLFNLHNEPTEQQKVKKNLLNKNLLYWKSIVLKRVPLERGWKRDITYM